MLDHVVMRMLRDMPVKAKRKLMREVIDLMVERDEPEEMALFLDKYLGGDAREIVAAHGKFKLPA